jgi:hypothetical protein
LTDIVHKNDICLPDDVLLEIDGFVWDNIIVKIIIIFSPKPSTHCCWKTGL